MKRSEATSRTSKSSSSEPSSVSRFQKFEARTIPRSAIRNAPYNPRKISDHARKKLKANIKEAGLVMTLVWNARTGNLVGGHQRISILDELEKSQDYQLTVAAVDVDERQEKELNLFLNNESAMGEWDSAALEALVKDLGDIRGTGFDAVELQTICDNLDSSIFSDEKEAAKGTIDEIAKIKERRKAALEANKMRDDSEFFAVVVFQNRTELDRFLVHCQLPLDQRYIDGRRMAGLVGLDLSINPDDTSQRLAK